MTVMLSIRKSGIFFGSFVCHSNVTAASVEEDIIVTLNTATLIGSKFSTNDCIKVFILCVLLLGALTINMRLVVFASAVTQSK